MRAGTDVFELFSNNVGSFSFNLGREWAMFSSQSVYVFEPLHIMMPKGRKRAPVHTFERTTDPRCFMTRIETWPVPFLAFNQRFTLAVAMFAECPPIADPPLRSLRDPAKLKFDLAPARFQMAELPQFFRLLSHRPPAALTFSRSIRLRGAEFFFFTVFFCFFRLP
jgi:hypothetical protein